MEDLNHTFVVAAYKESRYLEEAVASLMNQTVKSNIIIATATPNDHIRSVADKYGLPLRVNTGEGAKTISGDFTFAMHCADTDFMTIVHQDDVYEPDYTEQILRRAKNRDPIIVFTEYYEIRDGERVFSNKLLNVKRLMNTGFCLFPKSRFVRERVLSFGCPICCPSVAFPRRVYKDFRFSSHVVECVDWDAWLRLAKLQGEFLCIRKPLMGHRVHEESTTTQTIADNSRYNEELEIFRKLWPEWFAQRLISIYHTACSSNELK